MEWLERHRGNIAALLVVLVALSAFALLQVPRRPALQVVTSASTLPPQLIKVHVAGAVASPGVYQLPPDARVDDALKAAGGPTVAADVVSLNLAAPLRDGQQLVIPQDGAGATSAASASPPAAGTPRPTMSALTPSAKVNLNTASQKELEALPGIGEVTARRILDWRQSNGPFTTIDQLKDAKLVNTATFEKLLGLVDVR